MHHFNDTYFAELEQELGSLSPEERDAIVRELRSHHDDALADPTADDLLLNIALPEGAKQVGRSLKSIHRATRREVIKHRTFLTIATVLASIILVSSFIFPWLDGRMLAFVFGGIAVVGAVAALVGLWLPKPRLGSWLFWSGTAGITLVGIPSVMSFSSFYLIFGPLLLWTGTRLQRI